MILFIQILLILQMLIFKENTQIFYAFTIINTIILIYDFVKSIKKDNKRKLFKIGLCFQIISILLLSILTYKEFCTTERQQLIKNVSTKIEQNDNLNFNTNIVKFWSYTKLLKTDLALDSYNTMIDIVNKIQENSSEKENIEQNAENIITTTKTHINTINTILSQYTIMYCITITIIMLAEILKMNWKNDKKKIISNNTSVV